MRRLAAFAVLLLGCANASGFALDERGLRGPFSAYRVDYADPSRRQFVSADWTLDNFDKDEMKTKGPYRTVTSWVWPDGSVIPASFTTYDLKLTHNSSSAVIWVETVPISADLANKTMQAIAEEWVAGLNGTVFDFSFNRQPGAHRTGSKVLGSEPLRISGHPTYRVDCEVGDLDRVEFDEQAPRTRVRALFIQAPLRKVLNGSAATAVRAFLFVAYANNARAFGEHLPAFEAFVRRIQISR